MASISAFGLDVGTYGPLAKPDIIVGLAQHAERTGFDSIWLADHVAFPVTFSSEYPYSAKGDFPTALADPLMEPIATMGVLAGATKRIRIGTAVLIVPYRNPVVTARQLITLDNFSNGRIELGAGVGWLEEEFQVLGTYDFRKRGKATDEYLEIFKALARGGEVGFTGETYSFAPVYSAPGSVQRPHPPILVGGLADAALRRVVRHGDGWLAVAADAEKVTERIAALKLIAAEHGRRFEDLRLAFKIFLNLGEAKRGRFGREPGTGSAAEITDDLKRLFDLGFQRIIVRSRGTSEAVLRDQIDRFVDEIVPRA